MIDKNFIIKDNCLGDRKMATVSYCSSFAGVGDLACVPVMSDHCSTDELLGDTYTEKWEGDPFTSECRAYAEINAGNQAMYVPAIDAYVRRYLLTEANDITFPQQGSLIFDPHIETLIC